MAFGFSNGPLPTKAEKDAAPEAEESYTVAQSDEAEEILTDLANTLHIIAATSKDHKAIKAAVSALVRHRIAFPELVEK